MRNTIIVIIMLLFASIALASDVKDADLAGTWYPSSRIELSAMLQGYLDAANPERVEGRPFAIIVPHAGYQFSGPVAAYGYKLAANPGIKTVILIGFSHRQPFDGISIYDRGAFRTPLGEIAVNTELARDIESRSGRISFRPEPFTDENSLEMQIPFIQTVFKDAKIVPIEFGGMEFGDASILADALAGALKDRDDYIIVASTDLSHYHSYDEANSIDKHLLQVLGTMNANALFDEAQLGASELCGVMPVTAAILAAKKMGYDDIKVLKYANSGDTSGRKDNVVGYVSAVIYKNRGKGGEAIKEEGKDMFDEAQKKQLLRIARKSMTEYLKNGKRTNLSEKDPLLNKEMGAFVTLHERGQLRGCIGNMIGRGPLYQTVADMAIEAATGDPRFTPLSPSEIDKVDIEISVLTPLKRVKSADEIRIPGQGVLVRRGFASGVYLPQVATEAGWNKEEFLTSLCGHKAGMDPYAWKDPSTEMYTFEAIVFGEKDGSK